jgi:K+-transporting ATPase c subunit
LAPRVESALSGAGWEATGSQSVQARDVIDRSFGGLSSYGLMVVGEPGVNVLELNLALDKEAPVK